MRRRHPIPPSGLRRTAYVLATCLCIAWPTDGAAQRPVVTARNNFGAADRAAAASEIISLAVQQTISALPPASGQSPTYAYDPKSDTFAIVSTELGPVSFRTPSLLPAGKFGLRVGVSYFELSESFDPVPHSARTVNFGDQYTELGLSVGAKATVLNLSSDYGVTDWLQVGLVLPITIVDASAQDIFPSLEGFDGPVGVVSTEGPSNFDALLEAGTAGFFAEDFDPPGSNFSPKRFNSGTSAGVGRISVGGKVKLGEWDVFHAAFAPRFYFPSPSSDDFAGSDTAALAARILTSTRAADWCRVLANLGYEYDFETAELRRFIWDVGASLSADALTADLGVSGSLYDEGIEWTPSVATATPTDSSGETIHFQVDGDNRLGTNYIDFVFGLKYRVVGALLLLGQVQVPITSDGVRPNVAGTIGAEYLF